MAEIIIDGENAIMGRVASFVAKQALTGKEIVIVNCKQLIVSGNVLDIKARYLRKRQMGGSSQKGLLFPSSPERILKKTVKGMLPKSVRGTEALKRVMCYNEIPEKFKDSDKIKSKRLKGNWPHLDEISRLIK